MCKAQNGSLKNESIEDSLKDMAAYCLIALVLRREDDRERFLREELARRRVRETGAEEPRQLLDRPATPQPEPQTAASPPKQAASSKPPAIRVYIAGPISKGGLAENINRASKAFVALQKLGFAPFCPAWSCFASGVVESLAVILPGSSKPAPFALASASAAGLTHAEWLAVDLPWVRASHAVLRLAGESKGADLETAAAQEAGIPVFDAIADLVAWRESTCPPPS